MVITNDDSVRDSNDVKESEDTLGITSTNGDSNNDNSQSSEGESGSSVQVDTGALANEVVKAGISALATAAVTKKLISSE